MRQRHRAEVSSPSTQNSDPSDSEQTEKSHNSDYSFSPRKVFAFCLAFRVVNALLVQTYFNPDEHWQALEVAHRIAFGYGHLTWEWKKGIRSYLHPLLFALLYKVLAFLGLDIPWFMIKAPRLFQSLFSAVGDLYLYKLSVLLFGNRVAKWALFSQLTNWFMFFCTTRTLSNSMETVLTLVSLYHWPCLQSSPKKLTSMSRKFGVAIAALACAIRPTSAIIWLYIGLLELFLTQERLKFIFLDVAPIGVLVLGLTCVFDRLMYGSWILVPLNFLKFNFLSSGGDYYGTHKWHWYFSQGFTVMLFSFLPFSIAGIMQSKQWKLSGLVAWVLGLYSLLGHKEFRFVLPVLPIALMFSGYSLAAISIRNSPNGKRKESSSVSGKWPPKLRLPVLFLLATNIPMALYMNLIHQRGSEDVMNHLSKEVLYGKVKSILFLMPCHATPYYSTLHRDIPMRFLDCSPRFELQDLCELLFPPQDVVNFRSYFSLWHFVNSEDKGVIDESDRFMMDPVGFLSEYAKNWSIPSHIVLFESEEKLLKDFLETHSYREEKRFFHAHFKVDRDLQASVAMYALTGQ